MHDSRILLIKIYFKTSYEAIWKWYFISHDQKKQATSFPALHLPLFGDSKSLSPRLKRARHETCQSSVATCEAAAPTLPTPLSKGRNFPEFFYFKTHTFGNVISFVRRLFVTVVLILLLSVFGSNPASAQAIFMISDICLKSF